MFWRNLWRWLLQYRLRWWGWALLTLLGGMILVLVWLPHVVRQRVVTALSAATPATVRLADVSFHWRQGQLVLKGLSLTLPGEARAVVSADEIIGKPRWWSLLRGEKTLENISVSGVQIVLIREPRGNVNLSKLFPPVPAQPALETDLPTLTVEQFRLKDADFELHDQTHAPETAVSLTVDELTTGALNLQAKGLAAPIHMQMKGQLHSKGRLEGSFMSEAQLLWRRSETMVDATVKAEQLALALVEPYLESSLTIQQLAGRADGHLRYRWQSGGELHPVHAVSGAVTIAELAFADHLSTLPILHIANGQVVIDNIDLRSSEIHIASVKIKDPRLRVVQTPAGLNWTTLVRTQNASTPSAERETNGNSAWRWTIDDVEAQGGEVNYHDNAGTDTETVKLALETAQLQHLDPAGAESPFHVRVHEGESVVAGEGALRLSPLRVDAQWRLTEVSLSPFQTLLTRIGRVQSASGKLNGAVHTVLETHEGAQTISLDGVVEAPAFVISGLPAPENTMAWEAGHIEIRAGSSVLPLRLDITGQFANVTLQHLPQGDVSIGQANATLQLQQQEGGAEPAPPSPDEAPAAEPASAKLVVQGEFDVQNFLVSQGPEKQELVSCHHTKGRVTEGSRLSPLDLYLADVALEYPYVQGFRTASGRIQIAKPATESPPPTDTSEATTAASEQTTQTAGPSPDAAPAVHVDQIVLIGGQLYVEDHAIAPVQTIYWQDIRIDVSDAAYPLVRPSAFALHAFNMDGTPIEASGTTKRKDGMLVTTIHGTIERLRLPRFNAYLAPFLGYQVRKGAVSVKWEIAMPGDFVQAHAEVTLHDLGLSGKQSTSEVEQQVGLPMHLIIALLKDLNGNINLQVPVEGRLSEPGFHVGSSLWQAIRDVLIGAVTSPLKLLGAIFHKNDTLQDFTLDPIPFVPGASQPTLVGKEQIEHLRVFLTQRPELDLQLNSIPSPVDREALQDQLILAQLQASAPSSAQIQSSVERPAGEPEPSPEEEVRQSLLSAVNQRLEEKVPKQGKLSQQAARLLESLRRTVQIDATKLGQLTQNRLQTVTTALTGNTGVRADRLHLAPDKLRSSGGPEVQYMIQAREKR